jgi:hypothetical protein
VVIPKINNVLLSMPLPKEIMNLSNLDINIKQLPQMNLSSCQLFPTFKETYSYYISKQIEKLKSVNASLLKKKIKNPYERFPRKRFQLPFYVCFFCEKLECSRESMSILYLLVNLKEHTWQNITLAETL